MTYMQYTLAHWLLFFFLYCFLGWCIESAIVSIDTKKLTNRGFLQGPALPIYGFGAIMILLCTLPFNGNPFAQYIIGVISCTALEYVTGVLMEAIFKTKYWDYSGKFLNFQGRICLTSSLFWGVLTLFVIYVIHDPISRFVFGHMNIRLIIILDVIFSVIMLIDLYFSAKAAFMLTKIAQILDEVNVQLDLAKMEAKEALELKAEELSVHLDDMSDRLQFMGEGFANRVNALKERRNEALERAGFSVRNMIKNNPGARHKKFSGGYDELKAYVNDRIKNMKK